MVQLTENAVKMALPVRSCCIDRVLFYPMTYSDVRMLSICAWALHLSSESAWCSHYAAQLLSGDVTRSWIDMCRHTCFIPASIYTKKSLKNKTKQITRERCRKERVLNANKVISGRYIWAHMYVFQSKL